MAYLKTIQVLNGNLKVPFIISACDCCNAEIKESDYFFESEDGNAEYCMDCAFKNGLISDRKYLKLCGMDLDCFHAAINQSGDISIWVGSKIPPWDRTNKQNRNCAEYLAWRSAVFERDNYICADCGTRGGNLNAHHIKSYSCFPKLRLVTSNGITLCEKCHKKRHGKGEHNGRTQNVCKNHSRQ